MKLSTLAALAIAAAISLLIVPIQAGGSDVASLGSKNSSSSSSSDATSARNKEGLWEWLVWMEDKLLDSWGEGAKGTKVKLLPPSLTGSATNQDPAGTITTSRHDTMGTSSMVFAKPLTDTLEDPQRDDDYKDLQEEISSGRLLRGTPRPRPTQSPGSSFGGDVSIGNGGGSSNGSTEAQINKQQRNKWKNRADAMEKELEKQRKNLSPEQVAQIENQIIDLNINVLENKIQELETKEKSSGLSGPQKQKLKAKIQKAKHGVKLLKAKKVRKVSISDSDDTEGEPTDQEKLQKLEEGLQENKAVLEEDANIIEKGLVGVASNIQEVDRTRENIAKDKSDFKSNVKQVSKVWDRLSGTKKQKALGWMRRAKGKLKQRDDDAKKEALELETAQALGEVTVEKVKEQAEDVDKSIQKAEAAKELAKKGANLKTVQGKVRKALANKKATDEFKRGAEKQLQKIAEAIAKVDSKVEDALEEVDGKSAGPGLLSRILRAQKDFIAGKLKELEDADEDDDWAQYQKQWYKNKMEELGGEKDRLDKEKQKLDHQEEKLSKILDGSSEEVKQKLSPRAKERVTAILDKVRAKKNAHNVVGCKRGAGGGKAPSRGKGRGGGRRLFMYEGEDKLCGFDPTAFFGDRKPKRAYYDGEELTSYRDAKKVLHAEYKLRKQQANDLVLRFREPDVEEAERKDLHFKWNKLNKGLEWMQKLNSNQNAIMEKDDADEAELKRLEAEHDELVKKMHKVGGKNAKRSDLTPEEQRQFEENVSARRHFKEEKARAEYQRELNLNEFVEGMTKLKKMLDDVLGN